MGLEASEVEAAWPREAHPLPTSCLAERRAMADGECQSKNDVERKPQPEDPLA